MCVFLYKTIATTILAIQVCIWKLVGLVSFVYANSYILPLLFNSSTKQKKYETKKQQSREEENE